MPCGLSSRLNEQQLRVYVNIKTQWISWSPYQHHIDWSQVVEVLKQVLRSRILARLWTELNVSRMRPTAQLFHLLEQ